jgi:hypothetical protein
MTDPTQPLNPPPSPTGNPYPPGTPGNPDPPQPAADEPVEDEEVDKCEGCGALVPEGTLSETDDMVSLCPECYKLCDPVEEDEAAHALIDPLRKEGE